MALFRKRYNAMSAGSNSQSLSQLRQVELILPLRLASLSEELLSLQEVSLPVDLTHRSKVKVARLASLSRVFLRVLEEMVMGHTMPRHPLASFWAAVLLLALLLHHVFSAMLLHLAHSLAERLRQLLPSGCCTGVGHRVFQMCQVPVSPEDSPEHAKVPAFRQLSLP